MIINFGALHENTQDAKHQVAIFTGTQEVLSHMSCNMISIWDEQLHAMELCISDRIKLPAEGLEGERISLMCQCTGSQSCRRGHCWNDWVWVEQRTGRC